MRYEFCEWEGFAEKLYEIASESDYLALQVELSNNPEKGDRIQGLGGARKIRMALGAKGKRGGARVIYYLKLDSKIWLLEIYGKGSQSELDWHDRKRIAKAISYIKGYQ